MLDGEIASIQVNAKTTMDEAVGVLAHELGLVPATVRMLWDEREGVQGGDAIPGGEATVYIDEMETGVKECSPCLIVSEDSRTMTVPHLPPFAPQQQYARGAARDAEMTYCMRVCDLQGEVRVGLHLPTGCNQRKGPCDLTIAVDAALFGSDQQAGMFVSKGHAWIFQLSTGVVLASIASGIASFQPLVVLSGGGASATFMAQDRGPGHRMFSMRSVRFANGITKLVPVRALHPNGKIHSQTTVSHGIWAGGVDGTVGEIVSDAADHVVPMPF